MKLYLAGPINGCTDEQANGWRSEVKTIHPDVLDPMSRDYRGIEDCNAAEIVEGDKADIDACDGLLVWFERPSVGTSMEVLYAWEKDKFIVVINASGKSLSPWLIYHSDFVVTTIQEALNALKYRTP